MKKIFAVLFLLACITSKVSSQSLTCLTPTLVFTDPSQAGNPVISSTINCDFAGYIRIMTSPSLNGPLTQGNSPCIRLETSLTNGNSNTNNSMVLFEGSTSTGTVCSTCGVSIPSNSLFTLYWPGLEPSQSHSIALCHNTAAANMTYTVFSCYSNVILNSGTWSNAGSAGCQTLTIPANTAIGSASYVITPAVPAAAIYDNYGSGYITLDPWQMSPGTYTVTYNFNSQNGCTTSATRTLLIANPYNTGNTNFTSPTNLCPYSNCVNLAGTITGYTGSYAFPFFSGTGVASNTFCPTSSGAGTFPVTLEVGPTAVCGKTITNNITVNPLPNPVAASSASYTCNNPSTATLTASGGGTYAWFGPSIISQNGATGTAIVGPSTGNYSVTVTSAAGCTAQAVTSVVVNTTSVNVSPNPSSNVINCAATQATLSVVPISGVTYSWSGPGISGSITGSSIIATSGGNYSVVVTNTVNGCKTNTTVITATQNTTITNTPSTTGFIGCALSPVTLSTTASGPYTYLWTAPAGSTLTSGNGGQTATANATSGGNFTISVLNSVNQCSSTAVIALNVNQTQPTVVAANSGVVNCTNTAITLSTTTSGVTYNWVAPAGSSVSNSSLSSTGANGGGTYSLIVTSTANSCTNIATTAVTTQTTHPTAPSITNNPTLTCTGTVVTITSAAMAGVSYAWSGGTISGSSTNANVNVTSPAVYSLAVTSTSNGCTSVTPATISITQNTTAPTVGPVNGNTALAICNSTTAFTGSATPANSNPNWLGGIVSGQGSYTAAVSNPGTYTLVATNPANGCSAQTTFTLINSTGPAVILSSNSGTVTCANPTVQTIASTTSSPVSYNWSGPGIVGANNSATLSANQNGVYTLTLTNTITNCTVSTTYSVAANNAAINPGITPNNPTITCTNGSATLSANPTPASSSYIYNWSTSANTSSIIVNPTSTTVYSVVVTNTVNGCSGSQNYTITANTTPPTAVNVSPSSFTITCSSPTTMLSASATGASSYSWIAPASGSVLSSSSATANIQGAGIYTLIATGANGCSASAITATIIPDSNAPTFNLSNSSPSITCNNAAPGVSVTVTSTVPIQSYSWSPSAGISGPTNTSVVTFTAAGIYSGVITATNGCSTNTTIVVSSATTSPSMVAGSGTAQALSCTNTVVTINPSFSPSSNLSYSWTGSGIVGSPSSSSIQVNAPGSYSLTVTNTLTGCSTTSIVVPVTGSNIPPALTVSSSSSLGISCQPNSSTVTLDAQSGSAVTYSWSTGATTSSISTSSPGVYSVSVTDNNSGCVTASTVAVQNNTIAPNLTSSASGNLPCGSGSASLSASSSNTNVSYSWFGAGIVSGSNTASPLVNIAGVYTVTALDNVTGCSSSSTVSISQTTVSALAAADATTGPAPLNVNFTNQSLGATSYSWNFGDGNSSFATNPSNSFLNAGTYTVVLVSTNGACRANDTLIIKVQTALGVIPEVFTPNGDGKNDVFVIDGIDSYPNNNFQVFNRWGNPVYSAKPYKNDWNATPNVPGAMGSGKLPSGTYFYLLELNDKDKTIFKGFIQIQY